METATTQEASGPTAGEDAGAQATSSPAEDAAIREIAICDLDLRCEVLRLGDSSLVSRLQTSIEREGIHQPILASSSVATALVVLDGFKRLKAARQLGLDRVPVRVVGLDAAGAKAAIILANSIRCGLHEVEEALVVQSLHREDELSQTEIADLLGRHKSWVCRRLQLIERLATDVRRDLQLGLLSPTVARSLSLLPRGNQERAAQVVAEHRLSSRQAAKLVAVLKSSTPRERENVLADPLPYLSPSGERRRFPDDPKLDRVANQIREQLLRLETASNRLVELLRAHSPEGFAATAAEPLASLGRDVLPAVRSALAIVEDMAAEAKAAG